MVPCRKLAKQNSHSISQKLNSFEYRKAVATVSWFLSIASHLPARPEGTLVEELQY